MIPFHATHFPNGSVNPSPVVNIPDTAVHDKPSSVLYPILFPGVAPKNSLPTATHIFPLVAIPKRVDNEVVILDHVFPPSMLRII